MSGAMEKPSTLNGESLSEARHNLRTPINHILGSGDVVMIRTAAERLLALAGEILCPVEEAPPEIVVVPIALEVKPPTDKLKLAAHLLVVDDNEANRDVLRRRLEREGYRVSCAENGRRALEMVRAE